MTNLPRGLRIDHGYVQVRVRSAGQTYCRNFGKASPETLRLGAIHLSEKRKEILMGRFGYKPEVHTKKFKDVAALFHKLWSEQTTPEGLPKHTPRAVSNYKSFIESSLVPFFGHMDFHLITRREVQLWRDKRVLSVLGTSANREQAVLRGMFNYIKEWIAQERIPAFRIPELNPCEYVELAPNRKRERVLSLQELARLKESCVSDTSLWEICKMALKSLLRKKDLMKLEAGIIDIEQAKTGQRVQLPMDGTVLNYTNFRKRWEKVVKSSGLVDIQFRDLRKTGANLLKQKNWSNKIISEVLGHSNTRTTEIYMVPDQDHLKQPLNDLSQIVDNL